MLMLERITHHPMKKAIKNNELRVVIIVILLITSMVISSCDKPPVAQSTPSVSVTPEAVETSTTLATDLPTATSTSTPLPIQTQEPVSLGRTVYTFTADLDYNKHTLLVRQTIQYQNQTGQVLPEIKLVVPPNARQNVFSLSSVAVSGDVNMVDYSLDGITLTINLNQPLPDKASITIDLDFALAPRLQGGVLGYSAKQINFSDWYPFVPPYDFENGWIIHQPAEVGEYLVYDKADFDLTLNLVNPTGLVVAASAEAAPQDLDSIKIVHLNSRNITFSVSDQYTVLKNTSNGITVRGYCFIGDETACQASVDYTTNALQLFSELFSMPYPQQSMTVVESDFPDGMEYDGLYYLSDFYFKNYDSSFQNYLALLSVHETSHQWWFAAVANDQALEPWLDESLATYSEYLYIERYHPELTNWWWDYRINYYKPAGRVNLTIYDQSDLRTYINAVYLRGAVFLNQLRQALGDEAFFTGLRTYTTTFNGKIASWDDFIKIMALNPSDAIKVLFQEYYK
ncbi:hypothetical protein EG832_02070 [bacterium]|nr:hypothetical protein [bacterium]